MPVILIGDDDRGAGRMAAQVLEQHGFEVLDTTGGAPDLDGLMDQPLDIELLVIDIDRRSMRGLELAARARQRCPTLPLLFLSGRYEREFKTMAAADAHTRCLGKPYSGSDLMTTVSELLSVER